MSEISCIYESPIGALTLASDGAGLSALYFEVMKGGPAPRFEKTATDAVLDQTRAQLDEYFAGKRTGFDLPLSPRGTPFQVRVWDALLRIPFGRTQTYGELARDIGAPAATRAVGAAAGRNRIGIVIPCHRLIGASGALTGFAGGVEAKRALLAREGALVL